MIYTTKDFPYKSTTIFIVMVLILCSQKLFSQEISTVAEIYDFEVGDEFHIDYEIWWDASDGGEAHYYNDKILDKYYSENNDTVFYVNEQKHKWAYSPYHEWSYSQDTILDFYTNLSGLIRDGDIDTVYSDPELYNGRLINSKEFEFSGDEEEIFKYVDGLGLAYYYYYYYNLSGIEGGEIIRLRYFKKGNEEWGTPYLLLPIDEMLTVGEVYNYEIGDIFHIESSDSVYGVEYNRLYNKEVISKVLNGNYSVTYEVAVKEMLTTSENPEPVYDDYIDVEYYNYIDYPINGSEVDSIYSNPSFYNGRVVNTWNYGYSNSEFIKRKFVEGCGEVFYNKCYWLGNDYIKKRDELIYFNKGSEEWGIPNTIVFTEVNYEFTNSLQIYPNPTTDYITIKNNNSRLCELEILSLTGEIAKKLCFSNSQKLNISELKPGIYILKIKYEDNVLFKKIIKE